MSSLAQAVLDRGEVPWETSPERQQAAQWCLERLRSRLGRPGVQPPGACVLSSQNLSHTAERFVFEEPAYRVVGRMKEAGQVTHEVICQSARMPVSCLWFEWREEGGRCGFLVEDEPRGMMVVGVVETSSGQVAPYYLGVMDAVPRPSGGLSMRPGWMLGHESHGPSGHQESISVGHDVLSVLFLLTIPRLCEVRPHAASPKRQARREKEGLPPLVEVKKVYLSPGVGRPRYPRGGTSPSAEGQEDARHRKLHQVLGHLRVYQKERETPLPVWVEPHWRGDASLGVILHDRRVR